jgi:hypothetical protein
MRIHRLLAGRLFGVVALVAGVMTPMGAGIGRNRLVGAGWGVPDRLARLP